METSWFQVSLGEPQMNTVMNIEVAKQVYAVAL